MRSFFWIGKRFDIVLLYQSQLMIAVQLYLLHLCLVYRPLRAPGTPTRFWEWDTYSAYIRFLALLTLVLGSLQLLWGWWPVYVDVLGLAAMGVEATLPIPQLMNNHKRRSAAGFSLMVLATWFFGDAFKTGYYIYTAAPLQFLLCGATQLVMDCALVYQTMLYGTSTPSLA